MAGANSSWEEIEEERKFHEWRNKARYKQQELNDLLKDHSWYEFNINIPSVCSLINKHCVCQVHNDKFQNQLAVNNLKEKISYALFEDSNYKLERYKAETDKLYNCLRNNTGNKDAVKVGIVFVVLRDQANEDAPISIPVFFIPSEINHRERKFIDYSCRIYKNWTDYIENNTLPNAHYCYPCYGEYTESNVFKCDRTPAGQPGSLLADVFDKLTAVAILGAAVSAGPLMATVGAAAGVYSAARSVSKLIDKSEHGEDVSFENPEARVEWVSLVGSAAGAISKTARAGSKFRKTSKMSKALNIMSKGTQGISYAADAWVMFDCYNSGFQATRNIKLIQHCKFFFSIGITIVRNNPFSNELLWKEFFNRLIGWKDNVRGFVCVKVPEICTTMSMVVLKFWLKCIRLPLEMICEVLECIETAIECIESEEGKLSGKIKFVSRPMRNVTDFIRDLEAAIGEVDTLMNCKSNITKKTIAMLKLFAPALKCFYYGKRKAIPYFYGRKMDQHEEALLRKSERDDLQFVNNSRKLVIGISKEIAELRSFTGKNKKIKTRNYSDFNSCIGDIQSVLKDVETFFKTESHLTRIDLFLKFVQSTLRHSTMNRILSSHGKDVKEPVIEGLLRFLEDPSTRDYIHRLQSGVKTIEALRTNNKSVLAQARVIKAFLKNNKREIRKTSSLFFDWFRERDVAQHVEGTKDVQYSKTQEYYLCNHKGSEVHSLDTYLLIAQKCLNVGLGWPFIMDEQSIDGNDFDIQVHFLGKGIVTISTDNQSRVLTVSITRVA